jgi:hypothetical protein
MMLMGVCMGAAFGGYAGEEAVKDNKYQNMLKWREMMAHHGHH